MISDSHFQVQSDFFADRKVLYVVQLAIVADDDELHSLLNILLATMPRDQYRRVARDILARRATA